MIEGEGIMTVVLGTNCEVQFIHCSNRLKLSLFFELHSQLFAVLSEVTGPPVLLRLKCVFASKIWSCKYVEKEVLSSSLFFVY